MLSTRLQPSLAVDADKAIPHAGLSPSVIEMLPYRSRIAMSFRFCVFSYRPMLRCCILGITGLQLSACAADDIARHLTGRECNAGYIQQGEDWCAPAERPPAPQPYCTQSWNGVDCWSRPDLMPNVARQVAQGPTGLTQDQNANRLNLPLKETPPTNAYIP